MALENTIGPSRASQRPMNSTLEACTAPLVAAAGEHHRTLLSHSKTNEQHPGSLCSPSCGSSGEHHSIAIGPHSPYCHRETIDQYPESQQVPSPSNGDPYWTPYYHSETIEEHHESLYSPSCGTGDNTGPLVSVRNN